MKQCYEESRKLNECEDRVKLCHYCGDQASTQDHIVPLSRGGKNHPSNKVDACGTCNSNKSNNTYEEFTLFIEFVKKEKGSWKPLTKAQRRILKSRFLKETGIRIGASEENITPLT